MNSNQNISNKINLESSSTNPMINSNNMNEKKNQNSPSFNLLDHINISKQSKIKEDKNCLNIGNNNTNILLLEPVSKINKTVVPDNEKLSLPLNNVSSNSFPHNLNLAQNSKDRKENEKSKKISNEHQEKTEIDSKNNKIQFARKSINFFPNEIKKYSNEIINGVMKIKVYKSHMKQKRTTMQEGIKNEINIFSIEDDIKNKDIKESISKKVDSNKYKLLIKRIAFQLNRTTKPPTKGYFYVTITKTDKYLKIIKKIGKNMKKGTHSPTHGFFYSYIEKGKKYKLLIKRISSQLKKRVKLPTCKIIKIYESYRLLVKRIANSLKNSINNKNKSKNEPSPIDIENNSKNIDRPNDNIINNIQNDKFENREDDKMDIEIENNEIKNCEIKHDEENIINENIIIKSSQYENSSGTNQDRNNTLNFAQINMNKEEIPKSAEINKASNLDIDYIEVNDKIGTEEIEQLEKIEQNKKDFPSSIKKNNNYLPTISNENKEKDEPILIEEAQKAEKSQKTGEKIVIMKSDDKCKTNLNDIYLEKNTKKENCKISRDSKYMRSVPCLSKKDKEICLHLPIFKKENYIDEGQKKVQNRSLKKANINLNLNNFNYLNYNSNNNVLQEKINFSDLNVSDDNFMNLFQKFLTQEKIDIIDNFPIPQNESNAIYLQQSNFWYMLFCYIFHQKMNFSLYSIIHLLEQFNIWSKDKNEKDFYKIKEKITDFIKANYSQEIIEQFLFMNKFKDLNQLFEKFQINKSSQEYKEIKIDNINLINDDKNMECKCNLCTDENACIQKICELNKNKIIIDNNNTKFNLNGKNPEELKKIMKENLIKQNNRNNILHINECLFYQGIPDKNKNCQFSKSKIIIDSNTNLEYNCIILPNNDKLMEIKDEADNDKFNDNKIKDNNNIKEESEKNKENINKDNLIQDEDNIDNEKIIKTFKNISKIKEKEIQSEIPDDSDKSEIYEKDKNEENKKENNNKIKNEEENDIDKDENNKEGEKEDNEDNKNTKNVKKMKAKSRKKNKKKKDLTKSIKDKINEIKDEIEEEKTDKTAKSEEKSIKKRKKSGNSVYKKKNKSKVDEKNKDEEKNELEDILKEDKIEDIVSDDEESNGNIKMKKSKSPYKKKNKKH